MQVVLYVFDKRDNSTKRPVGGLAVEGLLRNASGVTAPTIDFQIENPIQYNYFYIPIFGRYYWLTEWTRTDGLWTASMQVDVLASWREHIGASSQYVTRSSAESDGAVVDDYYPAKVDTVYETSYPDPQPWLAVFESYVVGVVGATTSARTGCVSYYMMTPEMFMNFGNKMLSSPEYMGSDLGDITFDMLRTQINPFQYVVSCTRFPWSADGDIVTKIPLGWWTLDTKAYTIPEGYRHVDFFKITIPKHPQASIGKYLNHSPYTEYTLFLPSFGSIPLSSSALIDSTVLQGSVETDLINGKALLTLSTAESDVFYRDSTMLGAPVQIGQIAQDFVGGATAVAGGIANIAIKNYAGVGAAIGTAVDSFLPQSTTKGSNGSLIDFFRPTSLLATFKTITDTDPANHGKPLCKVRTISSLPGYVQCEKPDLTAPATAGELESIKSYMEGGFFYE